MSDGELQRIHILSIMIRCRIYKGDPAQRSSYVVLWPQSTMVKPSLLVGSNRFKQVCRDMPTTPCHDVTSLHDSLLRVQLYQWAVDTKFPWFLDWVTSLIKIFEYFFPPFFRLRREFLCLAATMAPMFWWKVRDRCRVAAIGWYSKYKHWRFSFLGLRVKLSSFKYGVERQYG